MSLSILGPKTTTVREAQRTLDDLWNQTNVETRAYTGNIVALTVRSHLERVQEALMGLEGRYAGRQIIGVLDGDDDVKVHASLVEQPGGIWVERLTLDASPEQLQGAILPLLRPATVNHVWWGTDTKPSGTLQKELTEIADQVIVDSLSLNMPPTGRYALADLGWSRSAPWREALAQIFDSSDAAARLREIDKLTVRYSGTRAGHHDLPARLFAGFVAATLGWNDFAQVDIRGSRCERLAGDLCLVELSGKDVRFSLSAQGGEQVEVRAEWPGMERVTQLQVPALTLADGLARVMARPERIDIFERAWALAKASL